MTWKIGDWEVHSDTSTLQCGSDTRHLTPRAMEVLVYLAEHSAETVSVDTLLKQFWTNPQVGEAAAYKIITELRHALDEDSKQPKYLKTVPKRGYRLNARIVEDSRSEVGKSAPSSNSANGSYRRITIAALSAVVLVSLFAALGPTQDALIPPLDPEQPPPTSLAILRFESHGDPGVDNSIPEGLVDAILVGLADMARINTISPRRSFKFSTAEYSLEEIEQLLQVENILEGKIETYSGGLRLDVQLTSTTDGVVLYKQRFDHSWKMI